MRFIHFRIATQRSQSMAFSGAGGDVPVVDHERRPHMTRNRNALVLGATGGIGGEVAWKLKARGWTVRALHRDPTRVTAGGRDQTGFTWLQGDAMRPEDVVAAAEGVSLIVH